MAGLTITAPDSMYRAAFQHASATATTGAVLFAMQNLSTTKTVFIKKISAKVKILGTAAVTTSNYLISRYNVPSSTNYSGGLAVVPSLISSGYSTATVVTACRQAVAGLVANGALIKGSPFIAFSVPNQNPTVAVPSFDYLWEFKRGSSSPHAIWDEELTLAPGADLITAEGLQLYVGANTLLSATMDFEIIWTEATAA